MIWETPEIWRNQDVFIIGGGPSLISSFNIPEETVSRVRGKKLPLSAYSPYMKSIHEKHIIGVNKAFQFGDFIDVCFFGDMSFLRANEKYLREFSGLIVSSSSSTKDYEWIKYLRNTNAFGNSISPFKHQIAFNGSSGGAAINLAVHFGAKRIILIGFDMNTDSSSHIHWHNEYRTEATEKKKTQFPFNIHLKPFPAIKKALDKLGIEIYNTSLNSAITCIEKKPLTEFL